MSPFYRGSSTDNGLLGSASLYILANHYPALVWVTKLSMPLHNNHGRYVKTEDLALLEEYLNNPELFESELKKNQGIQNLSRPLKFPKVESSKFNPPDLLEAAIGVASYLTPQLKAHLETVLCKKWQYCKNKTKYNNRLQLAVAIFAYLSSDGQTVQSIVKVMPLVLCTAVVVQNDYLNSFCHC